MPLGLPQPRHNSIHQPVSSTTSTQDQRSRELEKVGSYWSQKHPDTEQCIGTFMVDLSAHSIALLLVIVQGG